jgi:hypothetical protein
MDELELHKNGRTAIIDRCRWGYCHVVSFQEGRYPTAVLILPDAAITNVDELFEGVELTGKRYAPPPTRTQEAFSRLGVLIKVGALRLNRERRYTQLAAYELYVDGNPIEKISGIPSKGRVAAMREVKDLLRKYVRAERPDGTPVELF